MIFLSKIREWIKKNAIISSAKKISKDLGLIITFFGIVVAISNILFRVCGCRLIPILEMTLNTLHDFCHILLSTLIFSWFVPVLKSLYYGITYIGSLFLSISPVWPKIVLPSIIADLALISLALTRVFQMTDIVIPRKDRIDAEMKMTSNDWEDIKKAEGKFWGSIHRFLEIFNRGIWKLVNLFHKIMSYPVRQFPRVKKFFLNICTYIAGLIFMWGYIRFGGYFINVIASRKLSSPIMLTRKKFFRFFIFNLIGAIIASIIVIFTNGWLVKGK